MDAYRPSRYNFPATRPDGSVVYANTRSQAQVVVGPSYHEVLEASTTLTPGVDLPVDVVAVLASAGVLVPADADERAMAVADYRRDREDPGTLFLTVSPTISCNLRCTYCFEATHPPVFMSREDEADLRRFVQEQLPQHQGLQVTWFGGEPLLHPESVLRLSSAFLRLATFSGATYAADIVTNGTMLDDELAARLRRARVLSAQITLDGPPDSHDLLRPTAGGRTSYEQTVAGALAAHRQMDVELRVNLDRRNAEQMPELFEDLVRRGLAGASITFARTEPPAVYGPAMQQAIDALYFTVPDFAHAEVELLEMARRAGFRAGAALAGGDATPCGAVKRHHYAVEPKGLVKRCWAEVADEEQVTGRLDGGTLTVEERESTWRDYEPFDSGCLDCPALPICYGGCPKARIDGGMAEATTPEERLAFKERYVCSPRKFNLTDLLRRGLVS